MRIISFSSATVQSFWVLPVQALGPWMNRIKDSIRQVAHGDSDSRVHALTSVARVARVARVASNDAQFVAPLQLGNIVCKTAPLRVIRESDSAIGAECAGRMVISGRMADVCAELDRMALRADAAQAAGIATRQ